MVIYGKISVFAGKVFDLSTELTSKGNNVLFSPNKYVRVEV